MYKQVSNLYIRLLILSIVIILSLVLIVPIFSGCSVTSASNTFIELLSLVPADYTSGETGPTFYTLYDFARYYKDKGITFSTFNELLYSDVDTEMTVWLIGWGSDINGYGKYANSTTITDENMGYDLTNIDAEIQFGMPPTNGVASIGRFSPQDTANALKNQNEWPSWAVTAYDTEQYNGVTIHSWGSGLETHLTTRLSPPHIDNLGRARPLAITDNHLFSAASIEAVKLMIDAIQDKIQTLADLPEYAAIANGLTDLKAYAAIVGEGTLANLCLSLLEDESSRLSEEQKTILINSMGSRLKNFLTFGSGMGKDEKGYYTAIVIYHENSDTAQENVSLLKQRIENSDSVMLKKPWSEIITDSNIRAEGNVLLAKLYVDSVAYWAHWVYAGDTLLLQEE